MTIPSLSYTIDDLPVELVGFSGGSVAFGGFSQARGTVTEATARRIPSTVSQGSKLEAFANGQSVWEGRLSAPPAIRGGLASFAAQGESVRAVKRVTRLLFQSRDYSIWGEVGANPHAPVYSADQQVIATEGRDGILGWRIDSGVSLGVGNANGYVFWTPGSAITGYAFTIYRPVDTTVVDIKTFSAQGPQGGVTAVTTHALGPGSPQVITQSVSGNPDQLIIDLIPNTAFTNGGPFAVGIRDVRVQGIAGGDTFSGSEVVREVGGRLGYDTSGVTWTGLNVLPLDWTSSWAELLSYIATLEDRYWGVYEDGKLLFPAWGDKEWTVYQADGATVDLTPLELYNQVTVKYVDVGGAPREVTVTAAPDPLASTGIVNVWEESLADVQPDSTLATAVANNLLPRVSSQRWAGRIDAVKAYDHTGREAVREIRAGDTIRVADRDMNTATTHRVFETDQDSEGVACGIETGVSIASLLGRAGLVSARAPSTAELPELEIAAVEAGTFPSEEQQHRERFLTWPQAFKRPKQPRR